MKKRAFTLVELLAVLVIISLISILALSSISKSGNEYKNISYSKLEELFKSAAHSYIISDDNLVNSVKSGSAIEVPISLLVEKDYLSDTEIKNPKTNKNIDKINSIIKVSYSNNKYIYEITIYDKNVN